MKAGTIAFAETMAQAEALLALPDAAQLLVLAVTPQVAHFLEQAGRDAPALEDFYPAARLLQEGMENIRRVEALCAGLDERLTAHVADHPARRFVSFRAYFHPLKGLLDGLIFRGRPLVAAFEQLRPRSLIAFPQPAYLYQGLGLLGKPPVSLTSRLAPRIAAARRAPISWLAADNGYDAAGVALVTSARARGDDAVAHQPPRLGAPAGAPVLIHNLSASFGDALVVEWERAALGLTRTFRQAFSNARTAERRAALEPCGARLWAELAQDATFRAQFSLAGVDLFDLATPLLENLVCRGLPDLLAYADTVFETLSGLAPAVIVTGGMEGRNHVLGRVAGECGIPIVTTHFGGFYGFAHLPMHERYDLAEADYFLAGGPGCVRTLASPTPEAAWNPDTRRARPVALGLPWVDELLRRCRATAAELPGVTAGARPRRLLYVMSALAGDNHYLNHVYWPEVAYWRMQREIVRVVQEFPEVTLLLKPPLRDRYPQLHSPLLDWVARAALPRVEILPDLPLTACLERADAFLLDSPSTPLLELAATERPLLVYTERAVFRMVPEAVALLRRRAIHADQWPEFRAALRAFLARPDWKLPAPVDDDFLRAYASHAHDGRSAERGARFLRQAALDSARGRPPCPMRQADRLLQGITA